MNSDVLVTISGMQIEPLAEGEAVQTMQHGKYRSMAGKDVVAYDEHVGDAGAGGFSVVKNVLKIGDGLVTLTKRGYVTTEMVFKAGYQHAGIYETPYGTLHVGMVTSRLSISRNEESIDVGIDYGLDINYSHVSDCSILINIRSI